MSYKNLVLSAKASVEIENAIAHYAIVNKTLAIDLKKKSVLDSKLLLQIQKVFSVDILKSEYFG